MRSHRYKLIRAGVALLSITCLVLTGAVAYSLDLLPYGKNETTLNQQLERHLGISHQREETGIFIEEKLIEDRLEARAKETIVKITEEIIEEDIEDLLRPEEVSHQELLAKLPPEVLLASPKPPEKGQVELNAQTDNLNVLFIGVAEEELLMVSLYSIDYRDTWGSAAIFFPTRTVAAGSRASSSLATLGDIYQQGGVEALTDALEEKLRLEIDYHIRVDRQVLKRVAEIIDPIYVEGEEVDIHNLFDMEVTPHDDYILGELVKRLRQPSVYFFSLPELFISFRRHISTDFAITPSNLYLHYQIARQIRPELVHKTILTGNSYYHQGRLVQELPEEVWSNVVYNTTSIQISE